jgi:hypothetical protein
MEPPFSLDSTPIRLVSVTGDTLEIPTNLWATTRWFASTFSGWQPVGTQPPSGWPDNEPWPGEYDPAMGQVVTAEDAASLRDALIQSSAMFEAVARLPAAEKEAAVTESLSPDTAAKVGPILQKYGPGESAPRDFRMHVMLENWIEFFGRGAFRVGEPKRPFAT